MQSQPFTLEVTAIAEGRLVIFAEDIQAAATILEERTAELTDALVKDAGLPDNSKITFIYDVRHSFGAEVAGSESLQPGVFVVDECDHCVAEGEDDD